MTNLRRLALRVHLPAPRRHHRMSAATPGTSIDALRPLGLTCRDARWRRWRRPILRRRWRGGRFGSHTAACGRGRTRSAQRRFSARARADHARLDSWRRQHRLPRRLAGRRRGAARGNRPRAPRRPRGRAARAARARRGGPRRLRDDDALSRARASSAASAARSGTRAAPRRGASPAQVGLEARRARLRRERRAAEHPARAAGRAAEGRVGRAARDAGNPHDAIAGFDELAAAGANLEEATRAAAELLPEDELAVGCEEELFSLLALRWSTRRSSADDERVEAELAASTDCVARLLEVAERLRLRGASLRAEASLLPRERGRVRETHHV